MRRKVLEAPAASVAGVVLAVDFHSPLWFRQIVIHTISFGSSRFMRTLAAENGGQYVEIK